MATSSVLVNQLRVHQRMMKLESGDLMVGRGLTVSGHCSSDTNQIQRKTWQTWMSQLSRLAAPSLGQAALACFLPPCDKKSTASLLRCSCQEFKAQVWWWDPGWGVSPESLWNKGLRNSSKLEKTKEIWQQCMLLDWGTWTWLAQSDGVCGLHSDVRDMGWMMVSGVWVVWWYQNNTDFPIYMAVAELGRRVPLFGENKHWSILIMGNIATTCPQIVLKKDEGHAWMNVLKKKKS